MNVTRLVCRADATDSSTSVTAASASATSRDAGERSSHHKIGSDPSTGAGFATDNDCVIGSCCNIER